MSSDDEDFVFFGRPIERAEEITTRKKKAVSEASGQLRTALPVWKQEVTDEEGRRRFHGAFTGGFSAGYYNSVGSKEGWTPQSFTSSRKNRAEVTKQSIYNFLDEDEKADMEGRSVETSMQFDTFGFTAAEVARKQAEKEQQQRPSTIPGPVPDELIVPATESIGVKLLLKMGWRQGRSIKDSNRNSLNDARRQARKAFLALSDNAGSKNAYSKLNEEDTEDASDLRADEENQFSKSMPTKQVTAKARGYATVTALAFNLDRTHVLNPKQDLYGLGYDPFKQAPEFREKKRLRMSGKTEMEGYRSLSIKAKVGPGFGIGALEELDAEDADVYDSGYDFQDTYVQEIEEPSKVKVDTLRILNEKKDDVLPGFKVASNSECQLERFDPPVIPKDFVPHHKFPAPLGADAKNAEIPPPEVPPPEDNNLKILVEGVATLVARCGKLFEDLSREKNQSNPLFDFLRGGNGFDFYTRRLWEERQKRGEQAKLWEDKKPQSSEKLTAQKRGKILGEKALERSSIESSSLIASLGSVNVQFKLADTFASTTSANDQADIRKPFHDEPEKQKRFEQFLKEKYEGGLRTKDSGGSSNMAESARARERLEFEAAAAAIEKGNSAKVTKPTNQLLSDMSATSGLQFTSGGIEKDKSLQYEELITKAMYPKREEFQWRPAPILCKRFDLIDPYMGKLPPAPRMKSKMDSLMFMPDSIKTAKMEEPVPVERSSQVHNGNQDKRITEKEVENEVEPENVERPVDLYKAIFSDDSDDEGEITTSNQVEDTEKKIEAANTTLNRLIAGDFLESLGKELGLMVPPENIPLPEKKAGSKTAHKDNVDTKKVNEDSSVAENKMPSVVRNSTNVFLNKNITIDDSRSADRDSVGDGSKENISAKVGPGEERYQKTRKTRNHISSSEDERSRKHSRSRRHKSRRNSSSDSDTSDDSNDYHHRSSSRKRHKEKSSSRRHSKHHKHRKSSSGKEHSNKRKKSRYEE